jgi:hypothetical protein
MGQGLKQGLKPGAFKLWVEWVQQHAVHAPHREARVVVIEAPAVRHRHRHDVDAAATFAAAAAASSASVIAATVPGAEARDVGGGGERAGGGVVDVDVLQTSEELGGDGGGSHDVAVRVELESKKIY